MDDGRRVIYKAPLSDAEVSAYKRHPETFFGKLERVVGNGIASTLDMYAFIYESHRETPRERILAQLANAPNLEALKLWSDEDLRYELAERTVIGMIHKNPPKDVELRPRPSPEHGPTE